MATVERSLVARNSKRIVAHDLVNSIKTQIVDSIVRVGGVSKDEALKIFDESFVADGIYTRPWPLMNEAPDYWAREILADR